MISDDGRAPGTRRVKLTKSAKKIENRCMQRREAVRRIEDITDESTSSQGDE